MCVQHGLGRVRGGWLQGLGGWGSRTLRAVAAGSRDERRQRAGARRKALACEAAAQVHEQLKARVAPQRRSGRRQLVTRPRRRGQPRAWRLSLLLLPLVSCVRRGRRHEPSHGRQHVQQRAAVVGQAVVQRRGGGEQAVRLAQAQHLGCQRRRGGKAGSGP